MRPLKTFSRISINPVLSDCPDDQGKLLAYPTPTSTMKTPYNASGWDKFSDYLGKNSISISKNAVIRTRPVSSNVFEEILQNYWHYNTFTVPKEKSCRSSE